MVGEVLDAARCVLNVAGGAHWEFEVENRSIWCASRLELDIIGREQLLKS